MCKALLEIMEPEINKIADERAEKKVNKVLLEKQIEMIKNLMESTKWTAEQALEAMQVSDADRAVLQKRL